MAVDQTTDAVSGREGTPLPRDDEVHEILEDWRGRLRASPDVRPRTGERGQSEQALVRALLNAASGASESAGETPIDDERLQTLVLMSALYGANKPRERLDPQALYEEMAELRHAVWHHLRGQGLAPQTATDRILRFDRALSTALRAALSVSG